MRYGPDDDVAQKAFRQLDPVDSAVYMRDSPQYNEGLTTYVGQVNDLAERLSYEFGLTVPECLPHAVALMQAQATQILANQTGALAIAQLRAHESSEEADSPGHSMKRLADAFEDIGHRIDGLADAVRSLELNT